MGIKVLAEPFKTVEEEGTEVGGPCAVFMSSVVTDEIKTDDRWRKVTHSSALDLIHLLSQ